MKHLLLIVSCVALASCDMPPKPAKQQLNTSLDFIPEAESRVAVTRIDVIKDDIAYEGKRGVYVIRDNTSGQEFIGISGIGISELGSHTVQSGKSRRTVEDER
jgi:hypothetical protein